MSVVHNLSGLLESSPGSRTHGPSIQPETRPPGSTYPSLPTPFARELFATVAVHPIAYWCVITLVLTFVLRPRWMHWRSQGYTRLRRHSGRRVFYCSTAASNVLVVTITASRMRAPRTSDTVMAVWRHGNLEKALGIAHSPDGMLPNAVSTHSYRNRAP